ncbi:MAG: hypothetical protein ACHRHE_23100 [Tepidisphaerales bacterium]
MAALAFLVLATRLAWGGWSGHQVQRALAEARRHGPSSAPAGNSDLPDSQNAYIMQKNAAATLISMGIIKPPADEFSPLPGPPYQAAVIRKWRAAATLTLPALCAVRASRALPRSHVNRATAEAASHPALRREPVCGEMAALSAMLGLAAISAHATAANPEALECVADMIHLARTLRRDDRPGSQVMAMAIEAMACQCLQIIGPGLKEEDRQTGEPLLRRFIAQLLDEDELRQRFAAALEHDREAMLAGISSTCGGDWMLRPLMDDLKLDLSRRIDLTRDLALDPAKAGQGLPGAYTTGHVLNIVAELPVPGGTDYFDAAGFLGERFLETVAERRVTAVSLACQLFRMRVGRWPAELAELSPGELVRIPGDPFGAGQRPIGYRVANSPDTSVRPVAIFLDAENDGGVRPEPMYGWQDSRGIYLWRTRQYRDFGRPVPLVANGR